jgi:hypothetical protein
MTKELPSFDPVTVNENTVHLQDANEDDNHKIILVNTSTDKILCTYAFKGYNIYDSIFDYHFAQKIFIVLMSGRYLELDIPTGKVTEISLDFTVDTSFIFEDQLWIFPVQRDKKGQPTRVLKYNKDMESHWDTFKEGISYGDNTKFGNNAYLAYFSRMYDYYGIYNYTSDTLIDISNLSLYGTVPFLCNSYLFFRYDDPALQINMLMNDIFKINSFEPLSYEKFYTTPSDWNVFVTNVYEKNEDVFLYCSESIIVLDKNTKQLKQKVDLPEYRYISFSHCRNGSIWCCAEKSDGVYKFNMSDYSLKVIH